MKTLGIYDTPCVGDVFINADDGLTYEAEPDSWSNNESCVGCAFERSIAGCARAPGCLEVIFVLKEAS